MIEAKRKKGETFDSLLRRFQRRMQSSGKVLQVKKIRFLGKNQNKNQRRANALLREQKREKYAYELKTGQLKEEPPRRKSN